MHVVHVVPSLDRRYGGPAVSVPSLAIALRKCGFESTLVSVDVSDASNSLIAGNDLRWIRASPSPLSIGYHATGLQRALDKAVRDSGAEIIHVHSVWCFPLVAAHRAARKAKAHFVISPSGCRLTVESD